MSGTKKQTQEPVVEPPVASPPVEAPPEPDGPDYFRLRQPFVYVPLGGGGGHPLAAGLVFDSFNYDVDRMVLQGAQIDLLDGPHGKVLADYTEAVLTTTKAAE